MGGDPGARDDIPAPDRRRDPRPLLRGGRDDGARVRLPRNVLGPWGTKKEEHRWNLVTLGAINKALDAVENDPDVNVVLANEGKFWSNWADLHFMDKGDKEAVKECNKLMQATLARVMTFPLPTVAAVFLNVTAVFACGRKADSCLAQK